MEIELVLVEDNPLLLEALQKGFEATRQVDVVYAGGTGESALEFLRGRSKDPGNHAALLDVHLGEGLNGIETAVAIRREFPRFPIVFYSVQDDDSYFRAFRRAGILSHYAYVKKTNYLLPDMVLPLIRDAVAGRSYIDPEVEARVLEVIQKDEQDPLALLEPHERQAALLLARGLTNEQIASRMGYKDKRTVSRLNGQIYTVWNLRGPDVDEKTARTQAAIIALTGRMLKWDEAGDIFSLDKDGNWAPFQWPEGDLAGGSLE